MKQLSFPFMNRTSYNEKRIYPLDGQMHTLKELAAIAGVSPSTMQYRLRNRKLSPAQAVAAHKLSPSQAGQLGKQASIAAAMV